VEVEIHDRFSAWVFAARGRKTPIPTDMSSFFSCRVGAQRNVSEPIFYSRCMFANLRHFRRRLIPRGPVG
jgi:hypothetical protein